MVYYKGAKKRVDKRCLFPSDNALCQFYHLEVAEDTIVYSETHEGTHFVEAMDAGSAGVDVEGVDGAVVHHLEDV